MIDSQLLSYLIVFSETGSLLKSSEILHLSQPSLSKAMQKLEAELDLTIFDRTGNKITLNDDGKEILYYGIIGNTEAVSYIERLISERKSKRAEKKEEK